MELLVSCVDDTLHKSEYPLNPTDYSLLYWMLDVDYSKCRDTELTLAKKSLDRNSDRLFACDSGNEVSLSK